MKIKKGDKVIVRTGKERGKEGVVTKVISADNKIVIEGLNMRKKFVKAGAGKQGGIIEFSAPMDASNVNIFDPKSKKPSRVGYSIDAKGVKTRIAKKSGTKIS